MKRFQESLRDVTFLNKNSKRYPLLCGLNWKGV